MNERDFWVRGFVGSYEGELGWVVRGLGIRTMTMEKRSLDASVGCGNTAYTMCIHAPDANLFAGDRPWPGMPRRGTASKW